MNKSMIGLIIAIIVIVVAIAGFAVYRNNSENNNNAEENLTNSAQGNVEPEINVDNEEKTSVANTEDTTINEDTAKSENKILVVYYSAQNHTKSVAEKIAKNLNADIFEIVPEEVYSSADLDWTNSESRVSKEHEDESLRNVKLKNSKVNNWEDYDTVLIGYPIWWGIAAWPVDTFVKDNNFDGKKVIPFCTSSSSSLGQSGKLLQEKANSGNWQDGHRFSSSASDADIKKWTDSL